MVKKFRLKKPIYNRKVFVNEREADMYKKYKKMKLDKRLVDRVHTAIGICEGFIIAKNAKEELDAWQELIDTGVCWELQGWFGRTAQSLIDDGICKEKTIH